MASSQVDFGSCGIATSRWSARSPRSSGPPRRARSSRDD
jgi:hypothetical protein